MNQSKTLTINLQNKILEKNKITKVKLHKNICNYNIQILILCIFVTVLHDTLNNTKCTRRARS